jgi:hypothetical protein
MPMDTIYIFFPRLYWYWLLVFLHLMYMQTFAFVVCLLPEYIV